MTRVRTYGCREVLAHLEAYLDEELRKGTQQKIEQHLKQCHGCAARAAFERNLKSHLNAVGQGTVRTSFQKRIKKLIQTLKPS
ncbi:MAG TPA: zf-HC2 domain-containing protein [Nitrospira sp.]|nr:zf-HC2 domain-containing protein [Nitrospira sp.]